MVDIPLRDVPTQHIPIQTRWQVADLAARDALVLTEADIGGVCLVKSPPGFYDLRGVLPAAWDRRATDADILGTAPSARTIGTELPLTGGGDLSADRMLGIVAATPSVAGAMSSAHFAKLEALPDAVTLGGELSAMDAAIADNAANIAANTATIATHSTDIAANSAAIAGTSADLGALVALAWTRVANAAACAALPVSRGVAYVESFRDFFLYRQDSTAIVDGIMVLSAVGSVGRWERLGIPHASWSAQPLWYLNTAGNAEADGATLGSAIPVVEFIRRVGTTYAPRGTVTIYVAGDTSEPWTQTFNRDHSGNLVIQGVPTIQFSGLVSAKVDISTTGNGVTAKATSTWNPTTELGRLVKDTTNGRYSWVAKDLGANQAKLGTWVSFSETDGAETAGVIEGNTTIGAAIETYTLPQVSNFNWTFVGGKAAIAPGAIVVNKLELFSANPSQVHATGLNVLMSWQNCKIVTFRDAFGGGQHYLNNCWHASSSSGASGLTSYMIANAGVSPASWTNALSAGYRTAEFCKNILFQGGTFFIVRGTFLRLRNVFFEDAGANTVIKMLGGSQIDATAAVVCGNGNTGAVVAMAAGAKVMNGTSAAASVWKLSSGAAPIKFNEQTTCPAIDPATFLPSTARALTFANIDATYAAGGFGGAAYDPRQGCFFGASNAA